MTRSIAYAQVWTPATILESNVVGSLAALSPTSRLAAASASDGTGRIRTDGKTTITHASSAAVGGQSTTCRALIIVLIVVIIVAIAIVLQLAAWRWHKNTQRGSAAEASDVERQSIRERRRKRLEGMRERLNSQKSRIDDTFETDGPGHESIPFTDVTDVIKRSAGNDSIITLGSSVNGMRNGSSSSKAPWASTAAGSSCRSCVKCDVGEFGTKQDLNARLSVQTTGTFVSISTGAGPLTSPMRSESDDGASRLSRAIQESPVVSALLTELFELKSHDEDVSRRSSEGTGKNAKRKSFDWNRCAFDDEEEQAMWLPPSQPNSPPPGEKAHARSASESAVDVHDPPRFTLYDRPSANEHQPHTCTQSHTDGSNSLPRMMLPNIHVDGMAEGHSLQSIEECATYPPRTREQTECQGCQCRLAAQSSSSSALRQLRSVYSTPSAEATGGSTEHGRSLRRTTMSTSPTTLHKLHSSLDCLTKGSNRSTESLRRAGALAIRTGSVDSLRSAYERLPPISPTKQPLHITSPIDSQSSATSSIPSNDGRVPSFSNSRSRGGKLIRKSRQRNHSMRLPSTISNVSRQSAQSSPPGLADRPAAATTCRGRKASGDGELHFAQKP